MKNHNINSNNIVLDTVDAKDCTRSPASWLFTYNSGKYIEGLSVLSDVTGDSQWRSLWVPSCVDVHTAFVIAFYFLLVWSQS